MLARVNSGALVGGAAGTGRGKFRGEGRTKNFRRGPSRRGRKRIHKPRILGPLEQWILHAVYKNDGQSRAR